VMLAAVMERVGMIIVIVTMEVVVIGR
jgi:hypothetical protein